MRAPGAMLIVEFMLTSQDGSFYWRRHGEQCASPRAVHEGTGSTALSRWPRSCRMPAKRCWQARLEFTSHPLCTTAPSRPSTSPNRPGSTSTPCVAAKTRRAGSGQPITRRTATRTEIIIYIYIYWFSPENLLENTDGPSGGGFGAPHQCSLGMAACCFYIYMLTAALLMTTSHSEGTGVGRTSSFRSPCSQKPTRPSLQT